MSYVARWALAALLVLAAPLHAAPAGPSWIESWGTPLPLVPPPPPPFGKPAGGETPAPRPPFVTYPANLSDQTVRMIVRTSAGGSSFRLEFANVQLGSTVHIGAIHAGLAGPAGSIVAGSDRGVTFGGRGDLLLFPGARVLSDPIPLAVPALTEVAVSIYVPGRVATETVDPLSLVPTYVAKGNQVAQDQLAEAQLTGAYFWLRGLSVPAALPDAGTIVAFGDSITEGYATTAGAHRSWPELLAERLQRYPALAEWGVVNVGISGNRVLRAGAGDAAVARFDADVLTRPGVKWVILLEGINDINMSIMPGMPDGQKATAEQIIGGLESLVSRAHAQGIRVAGGTIMPTKGLPFYSAEGEAMRQAINAWIRTSGRVDAVIDFDSATRDPADPLRLRPDIDPGDHVHPNDAGNARMAAAVDPAIFKNSR